MTIRYYRLKIKLLDVEPSIWRRFVVPADISLDRLHDVIQVIMGWNDTHLFEITIGSKRYTEFSEYSEGGPECGKYRLGNLIKQKGRKFYYSYDFGDGWEHELSLEDSRYPNEASDASLICLDGARACPPEDVGGVPGYYNFVAAINNPDHEEHESCRQWIGGHYDAELFDRDSINLELMKYVRWSRDRYQPWLTEENS